jgi:branched-subunit amino acid ABC-type transport system permease component
MDFSILLQHITYGIVTGSILLLAAIGFSMIYTIKGFFNIAHGELLTVGAYLTYLFYVIMGWNFIYSAILAIILTTMIGLLIGKTLYEPMEKYGPVVLLFTTVGVAFAVHGITEMIVGPIIKSYRMLPTKAIRVAGIPLVGRREVLIVVIAVLSIFFLHLLLTRTRIGKAFRAMASNTNLAMVRGINTTKITNFVWMYASAMAALAGIMLAMITALTTDLGWEQILIIMAAAILGGLGSIYGVMVGAILLGLAMDIGVIIIPSAYRPAIAFAVIIIMLIIKPKGIFGGK